MNINDACMTNIQNAVALADERVAEAFQECLWQSGMPEEIIRECEVNVVVRESYI